MSKQEHPTVPAQGLSPEQIRIKALKRFALSITILNIVGHSVLGFETSVLQVLVTVATTYSLELLLEAIDAWSHDRRPAFMGDGFNGLFLFLLPAHITGFAISMLLFAHDEMLPYILAGTGAITSKAIFTVNVRGKSRHFLNPSNMGLAASVLLFERTGLAAPYEFTEHLTGFLFVLLPLFILTTGSLLNGKLTKRMPLIFSWVGAFIAQGVIRHLIFGTYLPASLTPITGVPFIIFTFYMVTDPATSPNSKRGQIAFGVSLAAIYGVLMVIHQPFTFIVALMILCVLRGALLYAFEHGFAPKLRAFIDGQPSAAAPALGPVVATPSAADEALAGPAMAQAVPAHGAE